MTKRNLSHRYKKPRGSSFVAGCKILDEVMQYSSPFIFFLGKAGELEGLVQALSRPEPEGLVPSAASH